MTLTDELKIRDDKIKANQAQHDLGREAAKISALSSNDLLQKFEYLTGEDLGHRPSVLEKTKFQCSPFSTLFSKTFEKDKLKVVPKARVILIMIAFISFTNFSKGIMNLKRFHQVLSTKR